MSTALQQTVSNDGIAEARWLVAAGETGDRCSLGQYSAPKTLQLDGTFGGGSIQIQGSNDGVTWHPLSIVDLVSGAYVLLTGLTVSNFAQLIENPRWIRPTVIGGDGTTAINVRISCP